MNRILQLQQDKAAHLDAAKAILDTAAADNGRSLTPEERTAFDAKTTLADGINNTITAEQRMASMATPPENTEEKRAAITTHDNRADEPFKNLGEQMLACRNAFYSPEQTDVRLKGNMIERRTPSGMSEAVPSDGGFLVQPDFAAEIIKHASETGLLASRCKKIPLSANTNALKINGVDETSRVNGSRWGGVQAYWQNEADAITASKPKFRQMELVTKKLTALYYATDELLQDTTALGAIASQAFGEEFGFKIDDAIIRGTGAGQPLGILNSLALISIAKETAQANTTVVAQNVINMWARMWGRSRANGVWLVNQDVEPQLQQMSIAVGTGGSLVYMPANGLTALPYSTLYGRPIIPIEQCDTLGNKSDILFVDLSQYVLVDKGDLQTAMSMHVRFINDELTFRFIMRLDGQSFWHNVLVPYKGTKSQSPFITLDPRP